jgi:NADH-quinone oxidoreductase subunit F
MERILTRNIHKEDSHALRVYEQGGGYEALRKALRSSPDEITEQVKKSGLRGRGGAGFPTGLKWSFMPKEKNQPHYLLLNADESEPGTFKDRLLMEKDPHLVLEGCMISSYAMRADACYIYIRGEFVFPAEVLDRAIAEAYEKGYAGKNILGSGWDCELILHRGAGAYICGEENDKNSGPKLYCLSGHVKRPGTYEAAMGLPLMELIDDLGGGMLHDDRPLKACIPGGSSVPVLRAEECEVNLDFDSLVALKTGLGSAGVMVMDSSTCMVNALHRISYFYAHESCGQCTPCRQGTGWLEKVLRRIESGQGAQGDVELLKSVADNIEGNTICALGEAAAWPVQSFVTKFRDEFQAHVDQKKCVVLDAQAAH